MKIRYTKEENNNVMSRYDHKIETSLEDKESTYNLREPSKEKSESKRRNQDNY